MVDTPVKICTSCEQLLPETKFKWRHYVGRPNASRHAQCNRCLYIKYTRPLVDRKMKKIHDYQLERGCADCGYNRNPAALEFDHLPGTEKLFNIGEEIGNKSVESLWSEIEKCEVVCANCHNIRTFERRRRIEI